MTSWIPNVDATDKDVDGSDDYSLDIAQVLSVEGDRSHQIRVQVITSDVEGVAKTPFDTSVICPLVGDIALPREGDLVIVGYARGQRPIILGSVYARQNSIENYDAGDRLVSHPEGRSHLWLYQSGDVTITNNNEEFETWSELRVNQDGSLEVENDTDAIVTVDTDGSITATSSGGATIELQPNGDVVINGGSTGAITDITTTTDADGHVTDVSLVRSSTIFIQ